MERSILAVLSHIPAARRQASTGWRIALATVLIVGAAPLEAQIRDPVPVPRARPGDAPTAAAATQAVQRRQAAPVAFDANSRFSRQQQAALSGINQYFNSFSTMQGDFIQFGPHGEQSEGVFHQQRPGKIRFQYSPPVKLDVISDGRNVAVRDGRTMTQDYYPLRKTPLRYLLAGNIDLTSQKLINEIREEPDLIALTIIEDSTFVKGKLTLIFDRRNYELKQWIVTDAQGLNTSVAIYNVSTGKRPDPGLFKINYYQGSN
jgi:outer membrane lipoprotein-sorting protein